MTLSPPFSGSKPQRGEDRVGGGRLGLPPDPFLHPGETLGGLVDVVAVGDVDNGFEELLEAFGTAEARRRRFRTASRSAYDRPHPCCVPHPTVFPRGVFPSGSARIHRLSVAG
ncbi:MAG TPA: hypothetical protein VG651_21020 [Stellaceae bacterium]|nr:hypothetical protein [Stellaceae bacterium]